MIQYESECHNCIFVSQTNLTVMINKICPCIAWVFGSSSPTRRGYQYEGRQQLEQQQFMDKADHEPKHARQVQQSLSEQVQIQKQLSPSLGLVEKAQKYSQPKLEPAIASKLQKYETKGKPEQTQSTSLVQEHQQQQQKPSPSNSKQQQTENPPVPQKQRKPKEYGFTNLGELVLNIPEYGPNYQLLKQKSANLAQLLDITQNCTQISLQSSSKLKINKTKLRVWRKSNNNCFILEYELPCSYSFYTEIMTRKIQPKQNNKLFRQYRQVQNLQANLGIRYICLNKIGMLQPREFTYLRYTNNSSTNPSGHWQLCVSKQSQNNQPVVVVPNNNTTIGNIKPGKLFSSSYIIQQQLTQDKVVVKVRTYVCLDIGVTVEKVWERILNQTKGYIQDIWEEAANNYANQLV